jgi:hypothetical protein
MAGQLSIVLGNEEDWATMQPMLRHKPGRFTRPLGSKLEPGGFWFGSRRGDRLS